MTTRTRGDGRIFARKGSAHLWCAYYLRGKEYRESTGTAEPEKAAKCLKRRLKEVGADQIGKATFVGPQQERMKVSKLLDALEEDYKLRAKDSPQFRAHLKHIRAYFGAWRAVEVSAEAVDKYISGRQGAGTAPATINRSTQLLAQAFKLAIERKHLSSAPQIRHLSEKGNARQGFFGDTDFHALRDKLPEYLRDFVQFGYLTAWRKGEVASLRWSDVEGDVVRLRGENAKNGEARSVTLSGDLADLMEPARYRGKWRRQPARSYPPMCSTRGGNQLEISAKLGPPHASLRAWGSLSVTAAIRRLRAISAETASELPSTAVASSMISY